MFDNIRYFARFELCQENTLRKYIKYFLDKARNIEYYHFICFVKLLEIDYVILFFGLPKPLPIPHSSIIKFQNLISVDYRVFNIAISITIATMLFVLRGISYSIKSYRQLFNNHKTRQRLSLDQLLEYLVIHVFLNFSNDSSVTIKQQNETVITDHLINRTAELRNSAKSIYRDLLRATNVLLIRTCMAKNKST